MFRSFEKSLDRELGRAAAGHGSAPARDPWLRDWPLLLGLVLSAALIAASTTISGSDARPAGHMTPKAAKAAGGEVPGAVVDVVETDPAEELAEPAKKAAKKKPKPSKAKADDAAPATEPTAEREADADTAPAQGNPSSPRRSTPRSGAGGSSGGGAAKPGRIVNVTGTSAAFTNGPLSYAFSAPTHTPTVGKRWRLQIAVKRSGAPLTGTVKIDILHNGGVVGHAASGKLQGGKFAHDFDWPERSAGYPLTVKTTVVGGGFQQSFLFAVKIKSGG